jgi:hypothetical protein
LLMILFISLSGALLIWIGENPPLHGKSLAELASTGVFLFSTVVILASVGGLVVVQAHRQFHTTLRLATLLFFGFLSILTVRTAVRAAYLHPNDATEYLVYAHGATGVKDVMTQIDKISTRTSGGENLVIAYDNSSPDRGVSWPFTWYLRHYPKPYRPSLEMNIIA